MLNKTKRLLGFVVFVWIISIACQVHAKNKYWIKVLPTVTGPYAVDVDVQTNIPGSVTLCLSLEMDGIKPDDPFIGMKSFIRIPAANGRAKGALDVSNPFDVYPHGKPLPGGKYRVEVICYPGWAENKVQAANLRITKPIVGKAMVQLVASGIPSTNTKAGGVSNTPSPQLTEFKKLYLELMSFKNNPEFRNLGFTWAPARAWEERRKKLCHFSNNTPTFIEEQKRIGVTATALVFLSADFMDGTQSESTISAIKKLNKAFGVKAGTIKTGSTVSSKNLYGFDVKSYCERVAEASGGSYQLESMCLDEENKAISRINSMNVPKRISDYCKSVGQAAGGSYSAALMCINQEIEAKERI